MAPWIIRRALTLVAFMALGPGPAAAGVQDWQMSEVVTAYQGDPAVRFLELANPVGGCLFPSSRLVVYGPDGAAQDSQPLVTATRCFAAGTFYLVATSGARAQFGVGADLGTVPVLPESAGQVCFVSSATHYDCVRWGSVAMPVPDLFGPGDATSTAVPTAQHALARIDATHVVAGDWALATPTPRGPNDGTPWFPPDAGPTADAAPPPPDARPPADAAMVPDARPVYDADPQRYLDVDPGGGALCSCGGGAERGGALTLLVIAWAVRRAAAPRITAGR